MTSPILPGLPLRSRSNTSRAGSVLATSHCLPGLGTVGCQFAGTFAFACVSAVRVLGEMGVRGSVVLVASVSVVIAAMHASALVRAASCCAFRLAASALYASAAACCDG